MTKRDISERRRQLRRGDRLLSVEDTLTAAALLIALKLTHSMAPAWTWTDTFIVIIGWFVFDVIIGFWRRRD